MALSLKESQALTELADQLYSYLPGKAHPYADQSLSFPGVAATLGLEKYWPGGSKLPAISRLLTATLEVERGSFCPLVLAVIKNGMMYRRSKEPITREEINGLNMIIARIGYKIPQLYDPDFLNSLPRRNKPNGSSFDAPSPQEIATLQAMFAELHLFEPTKRGFAFEQFLSELFELHCLAPRGSFRLVGEQIDGSFEMDSETYLLEARWRNEQAANADLLPLPPRSREKPNGRAACS